MNLWDRIKQELEAKLGPANYQKWIRRTAFARLEGGTLFVNVADEAARKWIETEYAAEVLAIASTSAAYSVSIHFLAASSATLTNSVPPSRRANAVRRIHFW